MVCGVFCVKDVFSIKGRGVLAVGIITQGIFRVGDEVIIIQKNGNKIKSTIKTIEGLGHIKYADKCMSFGLLLSNIKKDDIDTGDIIKSIE